MPEWLTLDYDEGGPIVLVNGLRYPFDSLEQVKQALLITPTKHDFIGMWVSLEQTLMMQQVGLGQRQIQ